MTDLLLQYGLVLLFLAVAVESAGVPIPGETALITAAFFARPERHHHWSLTSVIAVAAAGAIIGDNVGYSLGRYGGRRLIDRWSFVKHHADKVLPPSERFFKQHGAKTVFFGRFIALLRVTSAWLAGISRMEWWRFFLWNAAGGIVWAIGIGLLAYWAGKAVAEAFNRYGLYAVVALIVLFVLGFLGMKAYQRHAIRS